MFEQPGFAAEGEPRLRFPGHVLQVLTAGFEGGTAKELLLNRVAKGI
jgi:hypothetical protein